MNIKTWDERRNIGMFSTEQMMQAEIDELRAEIERLRGELALWANPDRSVIREMAALIQERNDLKTAHKANTTNMLELLAKHKQHAFNIAEQRKVLEQALEALTYQSPPSRQWPTSAVTAIQEQLK